ncbi:General stress protein 39 [Nocardia cerradoensis]|uniref:3-oxoacyl-[acyl-carrier-protein] reductase MabA n=1 Tax=Nocardia cerradoensis TaxID=85688 RepID=A0A231H8F3_9NOCA|nr:SDR family oxidoreductase [Nocardia cerradoensis]OXR45151.1 General stress protein 39 [Nocardia cerradoensis]
MSKRLEGRTALVTGGSRGLGAAISRQLAGDGATVAVHYRTEADAAREVVAAITSEGGRAVAVSGSMGDFAAVDRLVDDTVAAVGPIDLLVSNAGSASRGRSVVGSPDDEYERLLRIHALGPIHLVRRVIDGLRSAPRGDIIAISSSTVADAPPFAAPYTIAKSALETAIRTLAREERQHGIRANIVAPGLIDTDMGQRLVRAKTGSDIAGVGSQSPFGHVCQPQEVSGLVAFLASAEGGYITGQRITVNGGGQDPGIF